MLFAERVVGSKESLIRKSGVLLVLLLIGIGLGASPVSAQHSVTGEVTDAEEGGGLPGVNIVVAGTQIGTTTQSNGSYRLQAPSPADTLIFSFVGYEERRIAINGESEINVALEPAVTALQEVVVNVGYQEQAVETTTGSFSQISGADLEIDPATNVSNMLKGEITGVFGLNEGGRPGEEGSNLIIRGAATLNDNGPLVVIDGVPGRQGGFQNLNPRDIENITVLKDATAAIYGARAANGVILVTTKRGRAGETAINVSVEQSFNQPTVVPEMADAPTWMSMVNELNQFRGNETIFSQEEIERHRNCPTEPPGNWTCFDTDWYDAALKSYAPQTVANASVTGGGESFRYRVSGRALTKGGIATNSSTRFNQFGFRSNLEGDLNDHITLDLNLHGRLEHRDYPTTTTASHWGAIGTLKPTLPAQWPDGSPGPDVEDGNNPLVDASGKTGFDDRKNYFFQSNLPLEAEIPAVEGWRVEGTVAYDHSFLDRREWETPWTLNFWDGSTVDEEGIPVLNAAEKGVPEPRLSQFDESERDVLLRATTSYETDFGNHRTNVLLGTEYQTLDGSEFSAFRRFFPTDQLPQLFAGGTEQQNLSGTAWQSERLNFFGRANYNYQQKYLLEVVARYDGSYIFPEGDRFGFFPSVSAGWRLAQEDWFNNLTNDIFSRFKLRSSYGQTGNDRIDPYQFLRTFTFGDKVAFGDGIVTSVVPTRVPNRDITWEVATQLDVGIEGAILNERLTFDAAWYSNSRDDILWFRSEAVPETAGFDLPRENIGRVDSWGLEGQLGYAQDLTSDLSFRTGVNLSWTANEVVFIAEPEDRLSYQRAEGNPLNTDLYYIADGILNTQEEVDNNPTWPGARPGDVKFVDVNGDGQINADDRKRINENERPDIIGSFDLGFTYNTGAGQLRAAVNFQGAAQMQKSVWRNAGENGNYFQKFAERRWTPDNPDAEGPRAYNRVDPYWAHGKNPNTFFLRDSKYLRLKTARIGYTLPQRWSRGSFGMNQATVYVTGRNLFTLTPIDIMDPEMVSASANTYPQNKTLTLGIQVGF